MQAALTLQAFLTLLHDPTGSAFRQEVHYHDHACWLNQKQLAELFGIEVNAVHGYLRTLFENGELEEATVVRKIRIRKQEGKRQVSRELLFYRLEAAIALGFRVQSAQGVIMRRWMMDVLKEYTVHGCALEDKRLQQAPLSGQDQAAP